MKREERHQAKRNDLATLLEEAASYTQDNARQVAIMAVVLVVVIAGGFGIRGWMRSRDARASQQIGELIDTYTAPITVSVEDLESAQSGVHTFTSVDERAQKVQEISDAILKAGGSAMIRSAALLYRGMAQADRKMLDEAESSFGEASRLDPDGLFSSMARLRLARLKESRSKSEEALALYQAIADGSTGVLPREEGILGMARCQEALGRKDDALALYRRLLSEFPDSEYLAEARTHVGDAS